MHAFPCSEGRSQNDGIARAESRLNHGGRNLREPFPRQAGKQRRTTRTKANMLAANTKGPAIEPTSE